MTFNAKMALPDLQRYFWSINLIKNVEENKQLKEINHWYPGGGNVMCVCVCTKRVFVSLKYWSAKQCDWLSHARPAPFLSPLFLFHGFIVVRCQQNVPLSENKVRGKQRRLEWRGLKVRLTLILWEKKTRYIKVMWDEQLSFSFMNHSSGNVQSFL